MSDRTPFENNPRTLRCEEWEALLADALDGALTAEEKTRFEHHAAECPACADLLVQAREGQQWLQFLHPEPPVPSGLFQKILTQTSGADYASLAGSTSAAIPLPVATGTPEWKHFPIPAAMRRMLEPRMMMTAAMAFFSIALTLNMAGVRFTGFHAQDLRPSSLMSNLERQFYTAKAPVVRYYENLRVVYEVESRMRELRRTTEAEEAKPPVKTEEPKTPTTNENGGSAHKNGGKSESPRTAGPTTIFVGRPLQVNLQMLPEGRDRLSNHDSKTEVASNSLFPQRADQAERSLA